MRMGAKNKYCIKLLASSHETEGGGQLPALGWSAHTSWHSGSALSFSHVIMEASTQVRSTFLHLIPKQIKRNLSDTFKYSYPVFTSYP